MRRPSHCHVVGGGFVSIRMGLTAVSVSVCSSWMDGNAYGEFMSWAWYIRFCDLVLFTWLSTTYLPIYLFYPVIYSIHVPKISRCTTDFAATE